ncbi:MAG: outer membrane beta-barrel protein [Bacteroidales bacterium]|nr:outer membrane beta-barrel protein [Bacteroidales bacterium]MBN2757123.1 outer membrane beta-barrel protein [Bacteroidales bacterium]
MKKIIGLLLIISIITNLYAQENFLIISGGISQPKNDFASIDFSNSDAAFAEQGYNFNFEMSYYINDFVGFGANLRFSKLGFNSETYNSELKENFIDILDSVFLKSRDYNVHNFLFGPYLKVTFLERVTIYGKTFFGVMSTFRPNQLLAYRETGAEIIEIPIEGKFVGAIAVNFGAGLIVKITDGFGFTISADYIFAKPKFEEFNLKTFEVVEEKQPIVLKNFNAGIVLAF